MDVVIMGAAVMSAEALATPMAMARSGAMTPMVATAPGAMTMAGRRRRCPGIRAPERAHG